jgi:hypothetical protein
MFCNHNVSRDGLVIRWNLVWWVWSMELASIGGHWVLSTLAIHSSCAKICLWVTKWRENVTTPPSETFRDEYCLHLQHWRLTVRMSRSCDAEKNWNQVQKVATLVARNVNGATVAPMVGSAGDCVWRKSGVRLFVVYLTTLFQYLRLERVDFYSVLIRLPSSSEAVTCLESGCRFCVGSFGGNLVSVAVKIFSHLIYFIKKCINFVLPVRFEKIMLQ